MDNPKIEALPGDILHGKNNRNIPKVSPHFIIYLSPGNSHDTFLEAMLTSSGSHNNISLKESHFEKTDKHGSEWRAKPENQCILHIHKILADKLSLNR